MDRVGAPKRHVSAAMAEQLQLATARVAAAERDLWATCAAALEEGTYDQVAAVIGVARSTLQEKMRRRSSDASDSPRE